MGVEFKAAPGIRVLHRGAPRTAELWFHGTAGAEPELFLHPTINKENLFKQVYVISLHVFSFTLEKM